jgi:hypothetical protein
VKPFGIDVVVVQPGGVRSSIADSGSRELARFGAETSRYRRAFGGIQKRARASQEGAMSAEDFASEFVRRVLAASAPRVVRLGTGAGMLPKLAKMPGVVRDTILSGRYEVDKLP